MRSIKIFLLLTFSLWIAGRAIGSPVNSQTAGAIVKGWLQLDRSPLGARLGGNVRAVETFRGNDGLPLYHVVYLDPSGFVIVSGEDQAEPIVAFATQGRFDPSLKNPLGALVAKDLPVRVARARARGNNAPAALKAHGKWQLLQKSAGGGPQPLGLVNNSSIDDLRIAPFVQTLWNQETNNVNQAVYNYFTPPHAAGTLTNYPSGCVATALAQLMYYYKYPSVGVGTSSFQITVDGQNIYWPLRGGDGHGGPYQWSNMPLDPSGGASAVQRQAIGTLTYDAGVAVKMNYTAAESSSFMSDAKAALISTFKFNNAVMDEGTTLNVGVNLIGMINPNLDARLPVIFGIDNFAGGHCVLCDGYGYSLATLYHHLNMGWGGVDNAWYQLPIIDLSDTEPYLNIDACVYNIYTNGSGEIISGRVLDTGGLPVAGATVTATGSRGGKSIVVTDANGIYALQGLPSSSTYTLTVTNAFFAPAISNYSTTLSSDDGTNSGNVWGANFTLAAAAGPPVIATQPANQFVTIGSSATFAVTATGQLPLTYQWQCQPVGSATWNNLSDGGNFGGSGTAALTVIQPPLTNSGESFQCVITNALGSVTSSPPAVLVVNAAPFLSITTLAGIAGTNGSTDGSNRTTLYNDPVGVAVDAHTNVYVADLHNHVIRKLVLSGTNWVSSTIAGLAGNAGSADGSYTNARFNGPYGIAVDSGGNVYVADTGNSTIRMLTPSGGAWVVSTIAGLAGSTGSTNASNSGARFRYPMGLAVDGSGNIYVADEGNSVIREITSPGVWSVNTIAGLAGNAGSADGENNNARFNYPSGVAVDAAGNVYVADKLSCTIRKLVLIGGNWAVSTIAGQAYQSGSADGIGSAARFNSPTGVAVNNGGSIYVADEGNNTIRMLTPAGTNYTVFTAAGLAGNAGDIDGFGGTVQFDGPYGIAVDASTNVYVADSINNAIRGTPLFNPPPVPAVVQLAKQKAGGAALALTWSAMIGHTYQVQFKTNLSQNIWGNLSTVTMTNLAGSVSIPIGSDPQRYYRVILLQ
jgi:sugar lactone lactonase YvrE